MKWLGWGILAVISIVSGLAYPTSALIDTAPSSELPTKVNSPLLITGYSFSGHSVRYVQVYNSSSTVVSLDGWKVGYEYGAEQYELISLYGKLAPKQYITVGNGAVLPTATFVFTQTAAVAEPRLTSVFLLPPDSLNFNNETVAPSITASTIHVSEEGSSLPVYYFTRAIGSTGNYNVTFSAFIPSGNFTIASDSLYEPLAAPGVSIVEIYPDAPACEPASSAVCSDYVKLFNGTDQPIDLSQLRVRTGSYGQSSTSSNTTQLSGILAAGDYSSFQVTLSSSGSWVWLEDTYGTVLYESSVVAYPSSADHDSEAWGYNPSRQMWEWTMYPQPGNTPSQFVQLAAINMCSGITVHEIAANVADQDQFIEIINTSTDVVTLDGCVLQTNRSATTSHVLSGNMAGGTLRTIYIKDTPLNLTKTTTGTVYLLSSDTNVEVSSVTYENLAKNTSYSYIDGSWLQTYAMTPNATNVWQEYPVCQEGYFRNEETGYCNKIQTASVLAGCGIGKYRSPETNRCRNVASATSSLTACAANQTRNPLTNRCRLIATESALKPCAANQERNPETNRCRNKTAMITADFPVEAVAQSSEATLGWWAFGGVGLLALGYAGWEWRTELLGAIKKVISFIPSRG